MKKQSFSIICVVFLLILLASCNNNSVTIKGEIKNAGERKLYIEELNIATRKLVDTTKISPNGGFSFKYKFTRDEPSFLILRTDSLTLATLLLEKGEALNYSGDLKQPNKYTVEGSQGSQLVKELNDQLLVTTFKFDSLSKIIQKTDETTYRYSELNHELNALVVKHKQGLIRFIMQHITSFASFTAIYQRLSSDISFFGQNSDMLYYKTLADSLSVYYPNSVYVRILNDDYKQIANTINLQNMLDNAPVTNTIPDIELENNDGIKVKLTSLRGKFVLVDFWAASEKELLMNNRELVDIYDKYKSRNFEIYQISEDGEKEAWLEAIHNQEIKWISVRDTHSAYAAKLYNITQMPANYLINESGEILAKNLFGENLSKKLNELLPK